jgi:hypothetical protein
MRHTGSYRMGIGHIVSGSLRPEYSHLTQYMLGR